MLAYGSHIMHYNAYTRPKSIQINISTRNRGMLMGIAAAATARKNMLRRSAEWRANRRAMGDTKFISAEQQSRAKWNEFTKLSRDFAKAYPNEFKTFLMAKEHNKVAIQSFGLPRHMSAQVEAVAPSHPSHMLPTTLHDPRAIPSAASIEGRRLASAGSKRLAELGIRLD
jgi:hypothetical protein